MRQNSLARIGVAAVVLGSVILQGCTAVRVNAVSSAERIEHVCIEQNARVTVGDFVSVMQEGFQHHGITSSVVAPPANCKYTSTYTARRTWDITTYLSEAQIDIQRDGRTIATANYHLRGKGGLTLTKFAGTRSKILPVMDQLLAQVARPQPNSAREYVAPPSDPVEKVANTPSGDLSKKLAELKDAYDADLISKAEFDEKKKALIDEL